MVPMQELLNLSSGHRVMFFIKVDDRTDIDRPTKYLLVKFRDEPKYVNYAIAILPLMKVGWYQLIFIVLYTNNGIFFLTHPDFCFVLLLFENFPLTVQ